MVCRYRHGPVIGLGVALILLSSAPWTAAAQELSLNYESLSSLEEPLAVEIDDITLVLTGLLDTSMSAGSEHDDATDAGLIGNAQVAALAQLPNSWRVSLTYFGQYATDAAIGLRSDDQFVDNGAISVGSAWGTLLVGDVSGIVREQTRRRRGAGNGILAFDDVLGHLENPGAGYHGRFGPWVVSTAVDRDGNLDVGAMFQRPAGNRDYRIAFRATDAVYRTSDGSARFDTQAVAAVAEMIYGSTTYDAGVGLERLTSITRKSDRWFVSAGVRTKAGVVGISAGAHFGRTEGQDEFSAAMGLQYDIARGLSANLGFNHAHADVAVDGASLVQLDESEAVVSIRYSF